MKIYREEKMQVKKSWCLKLCEKSLRNGIRGVFLNAVDSETGQSISQLIDFQSDGKIETLRRSFDILGKMGYDPYEHNNSFDEDGRIVIDRE